MSLTQSTLNNRYAVWALVIASAIFGARAYFSIPMQLFPDTAPPLVNVITGYPGASAKDVNETLSQTLEQEFASLEGVVKIRTTSQDNMSIVSVEFQYDREVDLAAVDVQNAIAKIRGDLPNEILEPKVLKFSTSDRPVISIGVVAKDLVKARKMSDDVFAPLLQREAGVAATDVFGGSEPAVLVEINQRDVKAYGITLPYIVKVINEFNTARPAGQIRTSSNQTMFRLESRTQSIKELKRIPVTMQNGTRILLGEIGTVRYGSLDDDARFAVDGRPAIAIQVFKTSDSNTVAVVRDVEKKIEKLRKRYGEYEFIVGEESASFTEISVSNLLSNVWQALLFASVIIFLFLGRFKSSGVTIISMPLSYGLTFASMHAFGVEFNMVTLSAVILAVGMVVDSTVVILENITRRRDNDNISASQAAIEGTDEVRLSVLAGVATTLVVLIPLLFLNGFIGMTFGPLAMTLIFAFGSSVLVALVLVPVLSLYTGGKSGVDKIGEKLIMPFSWFMDRVRDGYTATLRVALNHRLLAIGFTFLLFGGSLYGLSKLGMEVLPKMDSGSFFVTIETSSGTSLDETEKIVRTIESELKKEPAILKLQSQVGFEQGMRTMSAFGAQGPTQGFITATLSNRTEREDTIWDIEARVRKIIEKVPGIKTSTVREMGNTAKSTTAAPIVVRISGEDAQILNKLGEDVRSKIIRVPNVIEPTRNWQYDQKQEVVKVDNLRAGQLGLSPAQVAISMSMGSYGLGAGDFYGLNGSADPIQVRYLSGDNLDINSMLDYPVFVPETHFPVSLRSIASVETKKGQGVFTREDLSPTLEVSAFTEGRPLNFIIADIEKSLEDIVIPDGYEIELTGEKSDLAEAKNELGGALGIALLAVYLLLVAQLRSFLHPLTIMLSIPLSLIGVFAALWIAGKPASMPVMVGMILLAGTVVNNAILLIEFVRQSRENGTTRRVALLESVSTRFRPIMMTSLSTIVGMIPLAAEWALGSERFSPLAVAVIGGMTTATLLTMIFIPVLYDLFDDISKAFSSLFKRSSVAMIIYSGLFLFSLNVKAQETRTLHLDECIKMALEDNNTIKQRKDETTAAMYRHKQARGRMFPKLVLNSGYSRVKHVEPESLQMEIPGMPPVEVQMVEAVDNRYFVKLSLEQPLFTGFALTSAIDTTVHLEKLSQEKERLVKSEIIMQVTETYFTLLKAIHLRDIAKESRDNLLEHKQQLQKLYESGRATNLELSRIDSRISSATVNMVQAEGAVYSAQIVLATLINVPSAENVKVVDILDITDSSFDETSEKMISKAYSNRAELGVASSSVSILTEKVDIEASGLWPQIGLKAGYTYSRPNQLYLPPSNETNGSWDVSVYLNWTLWDWGATYNGMKAAKAEESAANHAVEEIRNSIKIDVEHRLREFKTAAEQIVAAKMGIQSAKSALVDATELFNAGRITSFDLLNAQFELTQAKYKLVQALADARIAEARVQKSIGEN